MFSGLPTDFSPPLIAQRQKTVYCQDGLVWTAWFWPGMSFTWVRSAGKKQWLMSLPTSAWCAGWAFPGSSTSPHSEQSPGWPTHLAYAYFSLCKADFSSEGDVEVTTASFPATESSHTPPLFPINCNRVCSAVLTFFRDCISAIILPQKILILGYPSSPTLQMLWSPFSKPSYFWGSLAEAFCYSESKCTFSVMIRI